MAAVWVNPNEKNMPLMQAATIPRLSIVRAGMGCVQRRLHVRDELSAKIDFEQHLVPFAQGERTSRRT